MIAHKLDIRIHKKGYIELKNLPFKKGDEIEVIIFKKKRAKILDKLISNKHVWSLKDIMAVEKGRKIINQWNIS